MTVTGAGVAELETLLKKGRDDWIHGRLQWDDLDSPMAQADDATIFGPFGGIAPSGAAPTVRPDIQRQVASRFQGGSGSTELVRAIVEGDLVVVGLHRPEYRAIRRQRSRGALDASGNRGVPQPARQMSPTSPPRRSARALPRLGFDSDTSGVTHTRRTDRAARLTGPVGDPGIPLGGEVRTPQRLPVRALGS